MSMKVPTKTGMSGRVCVCVCAWTRLSFLFHSPLFPVPSTAAGPGLFAQLQGVFSWVREGPIRPLVKYGIKFNLQGKERRAESEGEALLR